ncbi:MAG: hypothetical protein E7553_00465 [Ruminococcaceae bacterium]|nr:hypothetical protein [Oscillospiraceae bacterium]
MKKSQKVFLTFLLCIAMVTALSLTAFAETESLPPDSFSPGGETFLPNLYNQPITMLKENGGLLFTTLLIGIALGIGGTLLVQHIRRKKK